MITRQKRFGFALLIIIVFFTMVEGAARLIWWRRAAEAFSATARRGEELLRNDAIHYMKQADPLYGYRLKPGFSQGDIFVNSQGFGQREVIPQERTPGLLRLAALGDSTTMGHDVDKGNYLVYLRRLLAERAREGHAGVEVINAGVPGWVSDQVALHAEHELAAFRPDIAILYVGGNDFQAYDPYGEYALSSFFESYIGGSKYHWQALSHCKSLVLLNALYGKYCVPRTAEPAPAKCKNASPEQLYRFLVQNLERIVTAFRGSNPNVQVCLCTLAARWPYLAPEEFREHAPIWWIKDHQLTCAEAIQCLARFNTVLRNYAASRGLLLIDTDAALAQLDRSRVQTDSFHFNNVGYELLAEIMYETLRQAGVIHGAKSPRRAELLSKFAQPSSGNSD